MFKLFSREPIHDPLAPPVPGAKTEIKTTTCYMCACRCGIRVHLRDGELRYIDGNPEHPLNKGVICAKGASGIMKQYSPARLTQPLLRKAGSERGARRVRADLVGARLRRCSTERLGRIRATDPKKFALFTGRDQMQALTGLFARQFGTPNYAAHGGFCSVNMAAGMIYTIGGIFWEFGGPDLDRAKLFVMIGTAEDHHSQPAEDRDLASSSARAAASSRSTRCAPAIRRSPTNGSRSSPGTDGALFMALLHELIAHRPASTTRSCSATPTRRSSSCSTRASATGLFAFDPTAGRRAIRRQPHNKLVWDRAVATRSARIPKASPTAATRRSRAATRSPTARRVTPSFQLLRERVADCTPEWAAAITGIPADTHPQARRARWARRRCEQRVRAADPLDRRLGQASTTTITGDPVAFHAMRGLAAHSNGFQTIRALAVLMCVLGTIDAPGGFRHKAPYPARTSSPNYRAFNSPDDVKPNTPLNAAPLGLPGRARRALHRRRRLAGAHRPGVLVGAPARRCTALMHNVITNAWRGDPYRIDTLMIFMANMAWNSSHEHDGGARDAEPTSDARTASTRSRSSWSATRSRAR